MSDTIITCNCEVVCFVISCAEAHHSCCIPHDQPRCSHLQSGSEVGIQRGATNTDERNSKWIMIQDHWWCSACYIWSCLSNERAAPFQRTWSKHSTCKYHLVSRTREPPFFVWGQFHILYSEMCGQHEGGLPMLIITVTVNSTGP